MYGQISFSWARYFMAIGIVNCFPLFLAMANNGLDASLAIVWLVLLSVCVFMAFGWARLRREHAARPFALTDMPRARRVLLGSPILAIAWFVLTVAAAIALAIATSL